MRSAPIDSLPANEAARLYALHQVDILHSQQEGVFDEMATLVAAIFNLPIAYISLVAEHESQCKAAHGVAVLPPQPRAMTLCAVVVRENQSVVYRDLAVATPAPAAAPAIERALAWQARFYAAAPLRLADEHSMGALCLVGQQPREFSAAEQQVLEYLAGIVSLVITVRHLCRRQPNARWTEVHALLQDEAHAMGTLVRYLTTRYGSHAPVPAEVLQPIMRRLTDLRNILEMYQYAQ